MRAATLLNPTYSQEGIHKQPRVLMKKLKLQGTNDGQNEEDCPTHYR